MPAENDFLPFAVGGGANVLSQAAYAALSAISTGYQSGVASSAALNKTWRQSSIMAAVIAQFIVAETGQTAIDDGTTATLLANFTQAVVAASKQRIILTDTGAANAYAAANAVPMTALPTSSGTVQTIQVAHLNTGASTYAPDGLAAKPIFGLGGLALQGGELPANGIATLVSYVGALLNSGNLCWVLYECIGGAQQVGPATQPTHALQYTQLVANIGDRRNLVCDIPTASASATFTAESVVVGTAVGGLLSLVTNLNATINIGTVGAGGMDVAGLPATANVAVYLIRNATTGAVALLGWNATTVAADTYPGSAMPAGYTQSALLAVLLVQTSQFIVCYVQDRHVTINQTNQVTTNSSASSNTLLSTGVPLNAKNADLNVTFTSTASTNANVAVGATSTGTLGTTSFQVSGGQSGSMYLRKFAIRTLQTIWFSIANSAGSPTTIISLIGWDI